MRNKLILKLLLATVLLVGYVQAEVMYTIPGSSTDTHSDSVSGFVDFFLTGCSTNGQTGCVLNIELQNTLSGAEVANQAISGVTFELSNAGTALAFTGTLSSSIASTRSGGAVQTITSAGATGSTGATGSWKAQAKPAGATWGSTGANVKFALDNTPGASTKDLIVTSSSGGSGAAGTDTSFGAHTPSYMGPVYFQITGITGLTSSTNVSSIALLFGDAGASSSPTGDFLFPATGDCTAIASGSCSGSTNGQIGYQLPEPVSFLLAGYGLLALFFLRRRSLRAN